MVVIVLQMLRSKRKNNKVYLNGTNTLAGSVVNMHDTFLNLLNMKISIQDAVRMTSYSASKFLKKRRYRID